MKLVIDIPEEDYKSACKREFSMDGSMMIYNAIREGTEYKERPHGEWIEANSTDLKCSICGHRELKERTLVTSLDYCSLCGADMRKEGERNE